MYKAFRSSSLVWKLDKLDDRQRLKKGMGGLAGGMEVCFFFAMMTMSQSCGPHRVVRKTASELMSRTGGLFHGFPGAHLI